MFKKMILIHRIFLIFFTIFIINGMMNGVAIAENRNVIIGFHQSDVPSEEKLVHDNGGKVKKTFHLISAISASMSEENITKLKKDSRIAYIENDSIYKASDEYTSSWGVQSIGSQPVHNQSITGVGVKIAILDTGIDYNHEDLKNNYKGGFDFINNDSDPWDDNCLTYYKTCHGTHVSGTIAAEHNGIGVVGVAPGASIYAVKVLDAGGYGAASFVVSGIEWAVANNISVISMSLESTENNTAVFNAVNAAYDSGILLIAAAGNTNGGAVGYPAAYDSVIAVSAIDKNNNIASFSAVGPKIELAAPGVNVNSTVCLTTQANTCIASGYGILSGTSMAAPHVTGVAALIFSTNFEDVNTDGKHDGKDVRLILQQTARDLGTPGRDNIFGFGVVDASNAVLGMPYTPNSPPVPAVPPKIMNSAPASPVNDSAGASRAFNITTDQIVNVTWYINGTLVGSINGVTNAQYTNNSASSGLWNVTVNASNINGSVVSSWTWNVTPVPVPPPVIINLILKRTNVKPEGDIQKVDLSHGKYSINIHNINLSKVEMKVYYKGILQKGLSKDFEFNKRNTNINIDLKINNARVTFIPYGEKGSIGYLTIETLTEIGKQEKKTTGNK